MKFVVSCDIGQLGPKEGKPITYNWKWYYSASKLLPWLILLAAIVLIKDNRDIRVLYILIPILLSNLLWSIFLKILQMPAESAEIFISIFNSFITAVALLLLLGHKIGNRNRFVSFILALIVMIVTGTIIFYCTSGFGFSASLMAFMIIYPAMTITTLLSFTLAGRGCKKSYKNAKFIILVTLWTLALGFIFTFLLCMTMITFFEDSVSIADVVVQIIIMGLAIGIILCVVLLPFVILAIRSEFFGRRLNAFLQLKSMELKLFKNTFTETESGENKHKEFPST